MKDKCTQWTRETALQMLSEIASCATSCALEREDGAFKNQTAMVALRAIDLANRMCGFAGPQDDEDVEAKKLEDFI